MTSVEERKSRIREFYAAMDRQEIDALKEMITPGYLLHFSGSPDADFTAVTGMMSMFFSAIPDLRHEVVEMFGAEDRVAVRLKVQGTHQGELMGAPASGNPVGFDSSNVFHFDGDRIAEQWITADMLSLLKQIGAMPSTN